MLDSSKKIDLTDEAAFLEVHNPSYDYIAPELISLFITGKVLCCFIIDCKAITDLTWCCRSWSRLYAILRVPAAFRVLLSL